MPSATTSCDVNVGHPFFLGVRPLHNWCESGGTPCPTPGFENRRMALGGYLLPHPPSSPMRDAQCSPLGLRTSSRLSRGLVGSAQTMLAPLTGRGSQDSRQGAPRLTRPLPSLCTNNPGRMPREVGSCFSGASLRRSSHCMDASEGADALKAGGPRNAASRESGGAQGSAPMVGGDGGT